MAVLEGRERAQALNLYLILAGIFIASLVACNLIFQKFFHWTPLGFFLDEASLVDIARYGALQATGLGESPTISALIPSYGALRYPGGALSSYTFEISVGILPYPITFLVTDIVSEVYGKKRANQLVIAGLVSSVFIMLVVFLSDYASATSWSPVDDVTFSKVFGLNAAGIGASMAAYLGAQFIDVQLFHFWKRVTKGRMLWVRNNFSTISSQLVDTSVVLLLLCSLGVIEWGLFWVLLFNGFLFKALVAAFDTPFLYLTTGAIRRRFKLKMGEEIEGL